MSHNFPPNLNLNIPSRPPASKKLQKALERSTCIKKEPPSPLHLHPLPQRRPRGHNEVGEQLKVGSITHSRVHDKRCFDAIFRDDRRSTIGTPFFAWLKRHLQKYALTLQHLQHHLGIGTGVSPSL